MGWTTADSSFETKDISVWREFVARSCSHLATDLGFESMCARLQKPYYFHLITEKYIQAQ